MSSLYEDVKDAGNTLYLVLAALALCGSIAAALGYNRPAKPRPDARVIGVKAGKTSGKFVRGFLRGLKESKLPRSGQETVR